MDSHLASVLISASLDIQNGSRCAEGPEAVAEVSQDSTGGSSPCSAPGNLQPCPVETAVAIRRDALSITGKKPEVGGTSQEESCIGGFKQPIAAKPGVPVLCSQPIRLRCVVPPQRSGPITNTAICRTKDFSCSAFTSAGILADKNKNNILISVDGDEGERKEKHQNVLHEPFHEADRRGEPPVGRHELNNKVSANQLERSFISSHTTIELLGLQGIKEGTTERSTLETPPPQQELDFQPWETSEGPPEEQTEPLDLSLPRKKERRCGRLLEDSGCEGLLIMEVDEYEGEGDRDVVEEDDEAAPPVNSALQESLLPSFFPTSVLTSLSPTEEDTEDLLLIDDQGIPYTLNPDGLKVLQVDVSASEDPRSERDDSAEEGGRRSPPATDPGPSRSLDTFAAAAAAAEDCAASPAPETAVGLTQAPEVFAIPAQAPASPCPSPGTAAPSQAIQIFPNHSASAPLLFLSSSSSSSSLLSSAPVGLTLPLTVTQPTSCSSSTPVFLLLSSVPSSSGESTSTPIALLDPSTGQLSKIDAASAPVSLPLPSGEVSDLSPPLSHPLIRLTPSNPPVVVAGVNHASAGSVFSSFPPPSSSPALQKELKSGAAVLLRPESQPSAPDPGSKAIVGGNAEEASHVSKEPLSSAVSPPHVSGGQSPATEPQVELSAVRTQHLPLDDHLYFSNPAASPSPPSAPALSPGKVSPLDPLDPGSPNSSLGPRRVLYCQLCPRVFFYLSDLERHAITHSQKKPHVCQQCGKAFKRSSHLQVGSLSLLVRDW